MPGVATVEFQPGDEVQLKSGGPVMTVERITKDSKNQDEVVIACIWFHYEGKKQILNRNNFLPVTLRKYEPGAGFAVMRM
jgi:uncharacterized protein YodC (DUF2158 family)